MQVYFIFQRKMEGKMKEAIREFKGEFGKLKGRTKVTIIGFFLAMIFTGVTNLSFRLYA